MPQTPPPGQQSANRHDLSIFANSPYGKRMRELSHQHAEAARKWGLYYWTDLIGPDHELTRAEAEKVVALKRQMLALQSEHLR